MITSDPPTAGKPDCWKKSETRPTICKTLLSRAYSAQLPIGPTLATFLLRGLGNVWLRAVCRIRVAPAGIFGRDFHPRKTQTFLRRTEKCGPHRRLRFQINQHEHSITLGESRIHECSKL
jgi:hypothetical protein